ncbi:MAG: hypothetical protein J5644_09275 [Bacteroidales bacterium]|nr:hypothetical protein [Bacteroidales bacterium]
MLQDPTPATSLSPSTVAERSLESTDRPIPQVGQAITETQGEKTDVSSDISDFEATIEVSESLEIPEVSGESADTDAVDTSSETVAPPTISSSDEKFETAWNTMFELLFREIPTVYYPMKGMTPQMKGHVIQVMVKNEMMKDNFESRVRLALEYLRNNYDPKVDDIVVEIEKTQEQPSKLIYDTQDKMNDLNKENPDLPEFLKILNLSAKDM